MPLNGKNALVTGAGRGIGQGIAIALAEAGANVAVADMDLSIAKQTAEKIAKLGRRTLALEVNVTDPESVKKMVQQVEADFGEVNIAVNNAGIVSLNSVEKLSAEEWDNVMGVNAKGVFLCTQAELTVMRPRKFGRIINVSSIAGKVGFPGLSHYSASKFAVIGFSNAVAKEVAGEGITVNALCPASRQPIFTSPHSGSNNSWAQEGETEEQSWERHQKTLLPQGVAQTPEDMGQLVVYLASASHVTGQAIAVDGGFSL